MSRLKPTAATASSVLLWREFIIIGEALRVISQQAPDLFNRIPEARQIIDFRNLLTHVSVSMN